MAAAKAKLLEEFPSLLRYNNPQLLNKHPEKKKGKQDLFVIRHQPLSCTSDDRRAETQEILNSILPPRCWTENGKMWQQSVSTAPSTRQEILRVQEMMDYQMEQTQALESGICPVRREIYFQCFNEVIRQVALHCWDRGRLLLRLRNEMYMTMRTLETMYCSVHAFALRKMLRHKQEKIVLLERIKEIEANKEVLEAQIIEITEEAEEEEKIVNAERAIEEKKYADKLAILVKNNAKTKAELNFVTTIKK